MRSLIFFQSLIFSKLFVILLIPSSVVKTGNLGILIVLNVFAFEVLNNFLAAHTMKCHKLAY